MATLRTVDEVIRNMYGSSQNELPVPPFSPVEGNIHKLGLAVESMSRHMTDEGWQLFSGLKEAGYVLAGKGIKSEVDFCAFGETWTYADLSDVAVALDKVIPNTVVVQDRREWEGLTAEKKRDVCLTNVSSLRERPDIFKVTILKDAQHDTTYNREAAEMIGAHAWVVYYHPRIVKALSPFVRERHLIRTYHSLDSFLVPKFDAAGRKGCIVSGALSKAYPLRVRMFNIAGVCGWVTLVHPGYHQRGCQTPEYLRTLSGYKVAVCTSSVYGYAVRKIIEATACGCRVVTDLPVDDVLPNIDDNLVRVGPDMEDSGITNIVGRLQQDWDPYLQEKRAEKAKAFYHYRAVGARLAEDIERMRRGYP